MVPIFEQGKESGIGHSFKSFINRFIDICQEHKKSNRAKSFAFILYDFHDTHIKHILKNQGGFAQLDRLSGDDLSVFYLHSSDRRLLKAFNDVFLGAFEISNQSYRLPFVLFFNVVNDDIIDVEVVEIEQSDLMFAFKELYDIIENYIVRVNDKTITEIQPTVNKLAKFWKSVKQVTLDKFIEWLIVKSGEYAGQYI